MAAIKVNYNGRDGVVVDGVFHEMVEVNHTPGVIEAIQGVLRYDSYDKCNNIIPVIRLIRTFASAYGLKEAKELVDRKLELIDAA